MTPLVLPFWMLPSMRYTKLQDRLDVMMRVWQICLIVGLLSGCAVGPDYQRPHIDVPQDWRVDYQEAAEMVGKRP